MCRAICSSCLLLLGALVCCAQEVNLAPNPGFELADGQQVAFWDKRTPDDAARSMVWSSEIARTGERSLGCINRQKTLSRWRAGELRDVVLKPGSECLLTGWVRTEELDGSALLRLYFIDAAGAIQGQPGSGSVTGTKGWTQLILPFTVPATDTYAMIYLEVEGTGSAWFDDLQLVGARADVSCIPGAPSFSYTPADFWRLDGYEVVSRSGRSMLQIPPGGNRTTGEALLYFTGHSARYDIHIDCLDEPDGASTLAAAVNGTVLGTHTLSETPADGQDTVATWTIPGIDVQRNSRLLLSGTADDGEYCRVVAIRFEPSGRFQGELLPYAQLPAPPSLRVHSLETDRRSARAMLPAYIHKYGIAPYEQQREQLLAALKTPEDWRACQQGIRDRLAEYWGPFPEKTPLNVQSVGTIERNQFSIEKVIYEGRPGYYVTASFYLPKGREFPVPGIILVCGHSAEGKGYHLYHECALGLVLKGYAVLAIDPTGQGERSEYFDADTLEHRVPLTVAQHHQLGRPSFLVGNTLGGFRTWDAMRGVDYLVSRSEVDAGRIGAVGNSGGGQMAFLVTAADERVAVCVAAHPGGSQENTYLNGQHTRDREILSLIAPRPCRVVIGDQSGEDRHVAKVDDMKRFYTGLGFDEARCEVKWVDGVHDLKEPKRLAAYEWFNRWFGKEDEGSEEPALEPLSAEELWCTETGFTLKSLGGETGQTLNAQRMAEIMPQRAAPANATGAQTQATALKQAVARRLGFEVAADRQPPDVQLGETFEGDGFTAGMLTLLPEADIRVPALLLRPAGETAGPLIVHAAERGKPQRADEPSLPLELCKRGCTVLSIDVRGVGETDPREGTFADTVAGYDADQWQRDCLGINAYGFMARSLEAMRAFDIIRAVDCLRTLPEYDGRPVTVVGEGLGGLWALIAAVYDDRVDGVVTVGTLLSYRMLIQSPYHEVRGYFWLPEALRDFDIAELGALIAPRSVAWIAPVDAMAKPVDAAAVDAYATWANSVAVMRGGPTQWQCGEVKSLDALAEMLVRKAGG
ncbi:MAG TPA: hypothetical protein DGT21_23970 [Armatimonadetes bacterium]|nr:hypothetical protein [Armatimonadota bacterium]